MNKLKSLFMFTSDQRKGIFALLSILLALQGIYHFVDFTTDRRVNPKAKKEWLDKQIQLDSALRQNKKESNKIRPFNPNYISDFKGYKLGMSTQEIDRLLAFRKLDKYVNSPKEFQEVTKVSDSLLAKISPYFKFPEWVTNKKSNFKAFESNKFPKKESLTILDINQATKEDLMKVNGIGEKKSDRILEQREKFGAFLSMDQMEDIWQLSPDVVKKLKEFFVVKSTEKAKKININTASIKELSAHPIFYMSKLPKEIVIYRSMNGDIRYEDLITIKGFPEDKLKIIALYLEF